MVVRSQTQDAATKDISTGWRSVVRSQPLRALKVPGWLKIEALPRLLISGQALDADQIWELLAALKASQIGRHHPLVLWVKDNVVGTADFAWALFEQWHGGDGEGKDNWAMVALGVWGDDETVYKLAPILRQMPSAGLSKRAGLGLDCLEAIGSDIALMQINQIAHKVKYQSLRTKAEDCMAAIGRARNLTREQLEDRIVPDCGFDATGCRWFEYGRDGEARSFQVMLGDELQLQIRDRQGQILKSLPRAKSSDDPARVEQALSNWKSMKRQVSEVVKVQQQRFEQAMVNLRRWSVGDFEAIVLGHPVLRQMARRLVWVGYGEKGSQCFRVTEDWSYGDGADHAAGLEGVESVGIVHAAQLTQAERDQWGELLSDYGIIPLFRQLTRTIFGLDEAELGAVKIDRFAGINVPSMVAGSILRNTGWQASRDGRVNLYCHYKWIDYAKVTAVVSHGGDIQMDYDLLKLGQVWFVAGEDWRSLPLGLDQVHPVAVSEVIRLVGAIAAKA